MYMSAFLIKTIFKRKVYINIFHYIYLNIENRTFSLNERILSVQQSNTCVRATSHQIAA